MNQTNEVPALDLEAIEGRANATNDGPWEYSYEHNGFVISAGGHIAQTWSKLEEDFRNAEANGTFIAHARADIPALIAEVRRLRAENEVLQDWKLMSKENSALADYYRTQVKKEHQ